MSYTIYRTVNLPNEKPYVQYITHGFETEEEANVFIKKHYGPDDIFKEEVEAFKYFVVQE
jgi:hypothetical protein